MVEYLNWSLLFWILIVHGLLLFLSTWLFEETLGDQKDTHMATILNGYLAAFSSKKLLSFSCLVGFVSLYSYCYSTAAPMIALQFLHLNPALYGTWNTLTMIGMFSAGIS